MIICDIRQGKERIRNKSRIGICNMYFGSVKFFRHLIFTAVFGWLGIATILAVFFAVKCHMLSSESTDSSAGKKSVADYVAMMEQEGISADEIIEYINSKEPTVITETQSSVQTETELVVSEDIIEPPQEEPAVSSENTEAVSDPYEDMYSEKAEKRSSDSSTVFLTFEGDISENASDILIILKNQNVTGTFFVSDISPDYEDTLTCALDYGCTAGVLAGENKSYLSAEDYLADFYDTYSMLKKVTGTAPSIYRIPDSAQMSSEVRSAVTAELDRRGFTEIGYNADSEDTASNADWQSIIDACGKNVFLNNMAGKSSVLRFHSGKDFYTTVITAEDVIITLKESGFNFSAADSTTKTE